MKKNKKTIIIALLFWITLSVVVFVHAKEDSMIMRILMAIASGPIVFFEAGVSSLAVAALFAGSFYLVQNLEAFKINETDSIGKAAEYAFNCSFGVAFVIFYYFAITNQHLFIKFTGGW